MNIARVFPRRTTMTPDDPLCFFDEPPRLSLPEIDEVHISVTWTYDKPRAEALAYQWEAVGVPVKVGGPAYDDPALTFTPGMYIKPGNVFTSRGCNNHCWFCMASKREGPIRELPVLEGWNILDNNLLQCSAEHINAVFDMLKRQKRRPVFSGGLEPRELKPWHCQRLKEIKADRMYFAYDTPDDLEPLMSAGKMLRDAGFNPQGHNICCYCLIGYPGDTFEKAEKRMREAITAGFMPYAMLYRDDAGRTDPEWRKFQRVWVRPAIVNSAMKGVWK